MISNLHFRDKKGVASMNKSKKNMMNKNIMIKTNIHNICFFSKVRKDKLN